MSIHSRRLFNDYSTPIPATYTDTVPNPNTPPPDTQADKQNKTPPPKEKESDEHD